MSRIYTSTAVDELDAELQRHLVAGPDGRCLTCGEQEPCPQRQELGNWLALTGRLPQRQPWVVGRQAFRWGRV